MIGQNLIIADCRSSYSLHFMDFIAVGHLCICDSLDLWTVWTFGQFGHVTVWTLLDA